MATQRNLVNRTSSLDNNLSPTPLHRLHMGRRFFQVLLPNAGVCVHHYSTRHVRFHISQIQSDTNYSESGWKLWEEKQCVSGFQEISFLRSAVIDLHLPSLHGNTRHGLPVWGNRQRQRQRHPSHFLLDFLRCFEFGGRLDLYLLRSDGETTFICKA